jgi:hypothetical protein
MSSDDYRDGCSKKDWTMTWLLVYAVYLAAWLADRTGKNRQV